MHLTQTNKYLKTDNTKNLFAKEWSKLENTQNIPSVYRKIIFVEHK